MYRLFKRFWLDAAAGGAAGGGEGGEGGAQTPPAAPPAQPPAPEMKQFTQEQITAMMTAEKHQGHSSALNALGVKDVDEAKRLLELARSIEDKTKPPEKKIEDKSAELAAALAAQQTAENKLEILKAKGKAESVDDIALLVQARVSKETDFKAALEAVKKAYPDFFEGDTPSGGGTGSPPNPKKNGAATAGQYGKAAASINAGYAKKGDGKVAGPDTFFN